MENFWVVLIAAAVGSSLIILNEWIKIFFERKKQRKKLSVWNALEQKDTTRPSLAIGELSDVTGMDSEELRPLIYEMVQDRTIVEGFSPGSFMRYR